MKSSQYDHIASKKLQQLIQDPFSDLCMEKIFPEALSLLKDGANPNVYRMEQSLLERCMEDIRNDSYTSIIYSEMLREGIISEHHISKDRENKLDTQPAFLLMLELIRYGANPNVYMIRPGDSISIFGNHIEFCHWRITPLGLVLLYKPDYLSFMLEKGAIPQTPGSKSESFFHGTDIGYDPVVMPLLKKWLKKGGFIISEPAVTVLADYKYELVEQGLVTQNSYLHTLDPRTVAGKVLWAQRGKEPCCLHKGALGNSLKRLNLSPMKVAAALADKGIVIDCRTGQYKPDTILCHARVTLRKIEINHKNRKLFNPGQTEIQALNLLKEAVYVTRPVNETMMEVFEKTCSMDTGDFFRECVLEFLRKAKPIYTTQLLHLKQMTAEETGKVLRASQSFFNLFLKTGGTDLIFPILACLKCKQAMQLRELSMEFEALINKMLPNLEKHWAHCKAKLEASRGVAFFCSGRMSVFQPKKTWVIHAEFYNTILEFKEKLAAAIQMPVESIHLMYRDYKNDRTISESHIRPNPENPVEFTISWSRGD